MNTERVEVGFLFGGLFIGTILGMCISAFVLEDIRIANLCDTRGHVYVSNGVRYECHKEEWK